MEDAKNAHQTPEPSPDFTDRVMASVYRKKSRGLPKRKLAFGVIGCIIMLIIAMYVQFGYRAQNKPPEKIMVFDDTNVLAEDQTDKDAYPIHRVNTYISMQLVKVLDQTIEAIERGEQQWEVEI
jgi:hypothetical protein